MKRFLVALLLAGATGAGAETWRFAVIGDTPYSSRERAELPSMLAAIADSHVDFIAHIGDFKHGKERCDDALFVDRHALFDASRVPFVFVPGDNEWTDCDRVSAGGYDPLERLGRLRSLFWKDDDSLGQRRLRLERQSAAYPEHARFQLGRVLFVTLNLPGDNNNFGRTDEPRPEFTARMPVVLGWLHENFALARERRLAGIVLLFQANPAFKRFGQGLPYRGYRTFLEALRDETTAFAGEVLVVHGDTHISRIDRPLRDAQGRTVPNLRRVETFGYPTMGWTRIVIDDDAPALFRFETNPWPPDGQ